MFYFAVRNPRARFEPGTRRALIRAVRSKALLDVISQSFAANRWCRYVLLPDATARQSAPSSAAARIVCVRQRKHRCVDSTGLTSSCHQLCDPLVERHILSELA